MIVSRALLPVATALLLSSGVIAEILGPATRPATAIEAFSRAAELRTVDSPANSSLDYPNGPSYPPAWHELAKKAFEANAPARAMVRGTRDLPPGNWPAWQPDDANTKSLHFLGDLRRIATDLGDAALYAAQQGRQNEALDLIDDIGLMADTLRIEPEPDGGLIRELVAVGLDALRFARLMEISPTLDLSPIAVDPIAPTRLPLMIRGLSQIHPASDRTKRIGEFNRAFADRSQATTQQADDNKQLDEDFRRFELTINRVKMEQAFAAVSLACQLYRADFGVWPESGDALVPNYLPALPVDPFAVPAAPIGYRLEAKGLPDGNDRPVVFSRHDSRDGLTVTDKRPLYSFYVGDGDPLSAPETYRKKLGQFRDVSSWKAK